MGQKIRRRRNRKEVKGLAIRRQTNSNSVRTIERQYGNVKVIEAERKNNKNGNKKGNDS